MIILTRDNVVSYIKDHVPSIKLEAPVQVNVIGEGELSEDVEGDGYCNFVFRVADKKASYIVKQSTSHLRRRGKAVTPKRNRYEYEIMQLRSKIVPQYVPTLYHGDFENNVFIPARFLSIWRQHISIPQSFIWSRRNTAVFSLIL